MIGKDLVKDTLFIDMKYIILYRKLGFKEISPDVFINNYSDTEIRIESEEQHFYFNGDNYQLKTHKDFVILECIDRLLKNNYKKENIIISKDEFDISLIEQKKIKLRFLVSDWGEYRTLKNNFAGKGLIPICLYTSQLAGGLVDYITEIHDKNEQYDYGVFENGALPFKFKFSKKDYSKKYGDEFSTVGNELIKYNGSSKIVKIPSGITRIGVGAFWNCLFLHEVILPETVQCICGDAFIYCENLKKINIPKFVAQIGDDPFAGAKELSIDNNSDSFILDENGVLFDKQKEILIHYPAHSTKEEYVIPKSVTWIGKHSFYKNKSIKLVTITENVSFMGNNAFSDCEYLILKNDSACFLYRDGALYNKEKTTIMHYSMGWPGDTLSIADTVRTIGRNCFWNCRNLKKIIIPESVRQIGYNPFAACVNLVFENYSKMYTVYNGILYDKDKKELVCCTSKIAENGVQIPYATINIGRSAFSGCESLCEIEIPFSVEYIGRNAFSGCISLAKITIPESVLYLGDWAFSNCEKLHEARIPKNLKIAPNVFFNCNAVKIIYY